MVSYSTSGGKSVPRYSSLRFELEVIGKLAEGDKDPYGFITRVKLVKDRLGANWRYTDLYYCVFRSMWAGDSIGCGPLIPV